MAAVEGSECVDFLQFQVLMFTTDKVNETSGVRGKTQKPTLSLKPKDILKKMRELDDKIIYTLNVNLPTESFKSQSDSSTACKDLFGQLQQNFNKREQAIQKCISFSKSKVSDLKKKKEINSDDVNVIKALRKEQSKLKLLKTELGVEEVVRDKTSKILYERCRMYYVPQNFNF